MQGAAPPSAAPALGSRAAGSSEKGKSGRGKNVGIVTGASAQDSSRSILSRACSRSFEITLDRAPGNRINFDMRRELFDAFARVAASRRKLPM